ncbi:MAG TPA: glycerol-3-phosphate 1-O-acyltransferase PlsY [Candidatus Angelobacter sp.]|nr:glycerol-3-phosphate 1-O-acyltransferase PlsY [Candidatus Angelobacter sp.]
MTLYFIVAIIAYLLGSIPFGYVLVKIFRGEDIRLSGSGNIGATNVARSGAKGLGVVTLLLDALKGVAAVWIAEIMTARFMPCHPGFEISCVEDLRPAATAALFAVLGHMFPVWLKFKGGKGVATALGVFVVLFPKAVLVSLAIFILVVALTRYISLGSILATIAFPIAAWFFYQTHYLSLLLVAITAALIIGKHHANIGRLLAGTESRFGGKKPSNAESKA